MKSILTKITEIGAKKVIAVAIGTIAITGTVGVTGATLMKNGVLFHTHEYVEEITTEQTCETDGVITFTCECGDSYTEVIVAVGHSYENYVSNEDATYLADGTETATCVCGLTDTRVAEGSKLEYTFEELEQSLYAKENVSVRSMPSEEGEEIGSLSEEQEVKVTGQCVETLWYRIEFAEGIGYVNNEYLSKEKPPKDVFIEKACTFWCPNEVVFYDAPDKNSNILYTKKPYEYLWFEAYNAKTGWYRVTTTYNNQGVTAYCYGENFLTREEYRALLNEGIDPQYYSLACVSSAEEYCTLGEVNDDGFTMTTVSNHDTGKACVHINGKHNFVTMELADKCGQRRFDAQNEFADMYLWYGEYEPDGTISLHCSKTWGREVYTAEEFYARYPNYRVFNAYGQPGDYSSEENAYVKAEVLKVLYGQ